MAIGNDNTIFLIDNNRLQKIVGNTVTTLTPALSNPGSIAIDSNGTIYIDCDSSNIQKFNASNNYGSSVGTLASINSFSQGMIVNNLNTRLWITGSTDIFYIDLFSGNITSPIIGAYEQYPYSDGQGTTARFSFLGGIIIDSSDKLYVADPWNHVIRMINQTLYVSTLAGTKNAFGIKDGLPNVGTFNLPFSLTFWNVTHLFVSDFRWTNSIRSVEISSGNIQTISGNTSKQFSDGPKNSTLSLRPFGLAIFGNSLYAVEEQTSTIRAVDYDTGYVTTLAGSNTMKNTNNNCLRLQAIFEKLNGGISFDLQGNLFLANSGSNHIDQINSTGWVNVVAGSKEGLGRSVPGDSVDGQGTAARFNYPSGILSNVRGHFVTDSDNNLIRFMNATGYVTTVAGNSIRGNFSYLLCAINPFNRFEQFSKYGWISVFIGIKPSNWNSRFPLFLIRYLYIRFK